MYGKIDTFNAEYDSFHQLNIMHLQNENLFLQNIINYGSMDGGIDKQTNQRQTYACY